MGTTNDVHTIKITSLHTLCTFLQMFEYVRIFIFPWMFFNLSPQVVALGFASVTSILVYTDKLENNIGLNTFRERVFTIEKPYNFERWKCYYISVFAILIAICLILVAFEKALIYGSLKYQLFYCYYCIGNLKFTFLVLLLLFSLFFIVTSYTRKF